MPLTESSSQHMHNAITLMTLHVDGVGPEAEARFGQSITAGNPYATGGPTAGLVSIASGS